ncbi:prohormone-2-like [Microplitis mediator]|uniref:prohormone-2-like n=1 Tax=Microplitis mediator TaxID=375433 RepID=UPI0025540136|nr:prohormone-2-like [Microplitis mediator]
MTFSWTRLFCVGIVVVAVESLATGLLEDVTKADQIMRPKAKRTQEILMFGNQQNRRIDNVAAASSANVEKRTLGASGFEDVKAALSDEEGFSDYKQPLNPLFERDNLSPYEKNYLYGKVMMNEVNDDLPRNWEIPPYPRYFNYGEDRRKRSEKTGSNNNSSPSSTVRPTQSTPPSSATTASPPPATTRSTQRTSLVQAKRSPPVYSELRYKRALDREDLLALLSLWENSSRNRNWRNYGNDEYENIEDDGSVAGLDDEDPRSGTWLEEPVYSPHHFNLNSDAVASEIGIPRTHPVNPYEQYNTQYVPPYENTQYGAAQYGSLYPQHSYYPSEKRFMVARKRSVGNDFYTGHNGDDFVRFSPMMNSLSQRYLNYPQRMLY